MSVQSCCGEQMITYGSDSSTHGDAKGTSDACSTAAGFTKAHPMVIHHLKAAPGRAKRHANKLVLAAVALVAVSYVQVVGAMLICYGLLSQPMHCCPRPQILESLVSCSNTLRCTPRRRAGVEHLEADGFRSVQVSMPSVPGCWCYGLPVSGAEQPCGHYFCVMHNTSSECIALLTAGLCAAQPSQAWGRQTRLCWRRRPCTALSERRA